MAKLTNKAKRVNAAYTHGDKTSKLVKNPCFKKMPRVARICLKWKQWKKWFAGILPLQTGFFGLSVRQVEDVALLQWFSLHICWTERLSTLWKRFYTVYGRWFPSEVCWLQKSAFIKSCVAIWPENCTTCRDIKLFDNRTPGLFKLQYEGDGIIFLCSKSASVNMTKQVPKVWARHKMTWIKIRLWMFYTKPRAKVKKKTLVSEH